LTDNYNKEESISARDKQKKPIHQERIGRPVITEPINNGSNVTEMHYGFLQSIFVTKDDV